MRTVQRVEAGQDASFETLTLVAGAHRLGVVVALHQGGHRGHDAELLPRLPRARRRRGVLGGRPDHSGVGAPLETRREAGPVRRSGPWSCRRASQRSGHPAVTAVDPRAHRGLLRVPVLGRDNPGAARRVALRRSGRVDCGDGAARLRDADRVAPRGRTAPHAIGPYRAQLHRRAARDRAHTHRATIGPHRAHLSGAAPRPVTHRVTERRAARLLRWGAAATGVILALRRG